MERRGEEWLPISKLLSCFVDRIELLSDILVRNDSFQPLPHHFLLADLEIFFCDSIKKLDSALGIGKNNRLFQIPE
jgi:hypothetical protein